jgi:hypothetical protein
MNIQGCNETLCQIESLDVDHTNHCMGHVDEIYGHFHPRMLFNTCFVHFHRHCQLHLGGRIHLCY